jgi:hypothetical protein
VARLALRPSPSPCSCWALLASWRRGLACLCRLAQMILATPSYLACWTLSTAAGEALCADEGDQSITEPCENRHRHYQSPPYQVHQGWLHRTNVWLRPDCRHTGIIVIVSILSVTMSTSAVDSLQNAIVDNISGVYLKNSPLLVVRGLVLLLTVPPMIVSLKVCASCCRLAECQLRKRRDACHWLRTDSFLFALAAAC